jgi:transcriptional regulator with XRE-family HTH domain
LNETLRRALLQARLTEEDVASLLEVDPKTVRRWMEGRVPYLRHRWAIAGLVGVDETDLWPHVGAARSLPKEVIAIYPHRDEIPRETWRNLFSSAEHDIGVLAEDGQFLIDDSGTLKALINRAGAGVRLRICIRDPYACEAPGGDSGRDVRDSLASWRQNMLAQYTPLQEIGEVEIRLHRAMLNNSIYRADDELLVDQHAYGIPHGRTPVLRLRQSDGGDMVTTYLESFERVWDQSAHA